MLDIKQNRDLIIVYCDGCASSIKLYADALDEHMLLHVAVRDCIEGHGWKVFDSTHYCRACVRKGRV